MSATRDGEAWAELLREGQAQGLGLSVVVKDAARGIAAGVSEGFPRAELRIPTKPITDSGVKPITQSGQADHLSERNDAGVHHASGTGWSPKRRHPSRRGASPSAGDHKEAESSSPARARHYLHRGSRPARHISWARCAPCARTTHCLRALRISGATERPATPPKQRPRADARHRDGGDHRNPRPRQHERG